MAKSRSVKLDILIVIRGAQDPADPADPAVCWEEQGPWRQPETETHQEDLGGGLNIQERSLALDIDQLLFDGLDTDPRSLR